MRAHRFAERIRQADPVARTGRVTRIFPTHFEADGPAVPLGALCRVETAGARGRGNAGDVLAQVTRVDQASISLARLDDSRADVSGGRVVAVSGDASVPLGDALMGRAVDGLGRPIDGQGPVHAAVRGDLWGTDIVPLDRTTPRIRLETGIRAIDGLLTLGRGQRVGIFSASGVGKTSLLAQLTRQVAADRCVICLVGERGREVESFWGDSLTAEGRARTTMVAATSDQPAALRVRAAEYAVALADHWRGQGLDVVLMLDSVTRLAMAMREIGLSAGEPPTVRAYTPGVFAAIPRLVERCGALKSGGSITALMTVLSETDDVDDPISELMKSLLDGHIILSRELAERRHFPAIDVPRSVSRLAERLVEEPQRRHADQALRHLGVYESSRILIESGVYVAGSHPEIDRALAARPALLAFLGQRSDERVSYAACCKALRALCGSGA